MERRGRNEVNEKRKKREFEDETFNIIDCPDSFLHPFRSSSSSPSFPLFPHHFSIRSITL